MNTLDRRRLRDLAAAAGIAVTGVTTAEPFGRVGDLVASRIREGRLKGMDWFTEERARFSADPRRLHPGARSIVSVGLPYYQEAPERPVEEPTGRIARYAWGRDYHRTLKRRMHALLASIEGAVGYPVEARLLVDTARIVDRAAAARAGLGWYGKNTMILVPGHGSWVMLGEMLLDLEIEPDIPLRPKCGRCSGCIDACPTGAIVADYTIHAPHCISYLTIEHRGPIPIELRPRMGDWVFGCDVCQDVCPYTRAAQAGDDPDFAPASVDNAFPRLRWILRLDEPTYRERFRGTAVLRCKRVGLARNAAVALGNVGTTQDLAILEETVCCHDEPLVRGHAVWAMSRIDAASGRPFLEARLDRERDPYVRSELLMAIAD
jgi:epoxyqueuosine reductase